jgi:hypothetical protein
MVMEIKVRKITLSGFINLLHSPCRDELYTGYLKVEEGHSKRLI